jgi:hypothetical protein
MWCLAPGGEGGQDFTLDLYAGESQQSCRFKCPLATIDFVANRASCC